MMMSNRSRLAGALFPTLLIVACAQAASPDAAQSGGVVKAAAPPAVEESTIVVPIRTSLAPLGPEIEARVQKTFAGTAQERGIDIRYDVMRDPIRLQMIGSGLHSSTRIKYAMEACRGRFPCISCGFDEARREADITLHTKLDWDPSWRLRSSTRLLPVHYARPCAVTWLDIDITRRFVAPVVEQNLAAAARIIDKSTPSLTNIRPQAEQVWTSLQNPTELAPNTWLVLEPTAVSLGPISGSGAIVTSTLSLRARTRVVVGAKPVVKLTPLPVLKTGAAGSQPAIRVPLDINLPYDEASRLATRDFANKTYKVNGRPLKLESLKIAPGANGRVLVEAMIDYDGGALRSYRGLVHLEGTPRFDAATSSIVVPDLEYSLAKSRRGLFARILERAAHDSIRQRLRESARFALGPQLAKVREEVTRALNRPLGKGVTLQGRADTIEPVSVTPLADTISLRVVATGRATVDLAIR
jgi:hypothetical protein